MTSFADFEPLTSAEGVTFTPWTDGHAVGFRITREQDDRVEIVSLSPSSDHNRPDWEGRGDVFVYHAAAGPGETVEDDVYGSPVCFIDVFEPAAGAPAGHRSAWVVVPSSPGMPYSETDPRRSGYNSMPCPLDDALNAAANARDSEIHLAIPTITEAFRVACDNHGGPPAFIIDEDEGNGNYTVVV